MTDLPFERPLPGSSRPLPEGLLGPLFLERLRSAALAELSDASTASPSLPVGVRVVCSPSVGDLLGFASVVRDLSAAISLPAVVRVEVFPEVCQRDVVCVVVQADGVGFRFGLPVYDVPGLSAEGYELYVRLRADGTRHEEAHGLALLLIPPVGVSS